MTVDEAIDYCEESGSMLKAVLRGYGYALFAENIDPFKGWEKRTRDCFGGFIYTRRLGGYEGTPPEEAFVEK